ncbi:DNA-binding NarL/FixJ family response regulator [Deinobacterium chartae]|uniref:DNA-binding NarL/FixJ family response regulator n=1 Tax=Deinobacterium chartae TaxID=521158 RepID=A0A841I2B4_9DEIO|nr:LuxR C-terminal-related transcriptional regulator [Deinobacterium chartae]MBB6098192.1 DNA-binding NarL/FixJ family response regulator [Deinobacterium chartae]
MASLSSVDTCLPVRLLCGLEGLRQELSVALRLRGYPPSENAAVTLLVDAPWGYALEELPRVREAVNRVVVVTDSPCPEYWEDLWDLGAGGLLAEDVRMAEVGPALELVLSGQRLRRTPPRLTQLTVAERALLRCNALGWNNRRIAQALGLNERTIKNGLSRIYEKLGLENRTQAALYYWGMWRILGLEAEYGVRGRYFSPERA